MHAGLGGVMSASEVQRDRPQRRLGIGMHVLATLTISMPVLPTRLETSGAMQAHAHIIFATARDSVCVLKPGPIFPSGAGTVIGFLPRRQALALTRQTEQDLRAQLNPQFSDNPRAILASKAFGSAKRIIAVVPPSLSIALGDEVTYKGGYTDTSLPCHYIPNLISRIVSRKDSSMRSPSLDEAKTIWDDTNQTAQLDKNIVLFNLVFDRVSQSDISKPDGIALFDHAIDGLRASQNSLERDPQILREQNELKRLGAADSESLHKAGEIFRGIVVQLRSRFADAMTAQALIKHAIDGMLSSLNSGAAYINPQALSGLHPQPGAIGLTFKLDHDGARVVSVVGDAPAAKSGVRVSDLITRIDGSPVSGMADSFEASEKLGGAVDSWVTITIMRPGCNAPFDTRIKREDRNHVDIQTGVLGTVGYLRVRSFSPMTLADLTTAITSFDTRIGNSLTGYVIDLRDNGGGLFDQAVAFADAFLDSGIIVTQRGREPAENKSFNARPGDIARGKPIAVLVNENTASGAEVVAAALKDNIRAKLVGTRTTGLGVLRTYFPLGPGSRDGSLELATGELLTPLGQRIQGAGVDPDFQVRPTENAKDEAVGCVQANKAPTKQGEDAQLQYALALLSRTKQ